MNQAAAPSTRKLMKLGMNALEKHRAQEAINYFHQVLRLNPNHVEALHQVGYIMHSAGKYAEAMNFYQRAIHADHTYIESYLWLCKVLETQNRGQEAIQLAVRATEIAPDNVKAHGELIAILTRFNQVHMVPNYIEGILPRFPNDDTILQHYAFSLLVNDRKAEADAMYAKLLANHRPKANFRFLYETYLPRLNMEASAIDTQRAGLEESLTKFLDSKWKVEIDLITFLPTFQLAFHNRNNKELAQLYTKTLRAASSTLNYVAPHCKAALARKDGPIRVGFVSRHMHNHSVGSCFRQMMIDLSREPGFEVTFFNLANVMDDKLQLILDANVPIVSLPKMLESCQQKIAGYNLDILIFPDLGMDAMSHYIAMARLARYQCCFLGHPDTTGIDTLDYVISSDFYEPENGQEQYSETLLRPRTIDTIFIPPKAPERWLTREELQLPTNKKLYVCPMAIQKFHPDFDGLLAKILERDPEAMLVLFSDFQQQATSEQLRQRISQRCDPSRLIFMPWLPLDTLFSVLKTADTVLDTIYFGGGTTIQYAFSFGVPVVSMPGTFARGRMVHAYYSMMGVEDAPLAKEEDEYVSLAVKVAHDTAYKESISAQILEKKHLLGAGSPYTPKLHEVLNAIMDQDLDRYRHPLKA